MRPEELYRPQRFVEVYGQDRAVLLLQRLIKRGKQRRHLLLRGDTGSGKTSLVRLYDKALNCEHNEADGSPCGACSPCIYRADKGAFEYDTAGTGGSREQIVQFLGRVRHLELPGKIRVAFFDEAHRLELAAADALLKQIEDPDGQIVFCFATTEKLPPAVVSRLMVVTVRALTHGTAVKFLDDIARRMGIEFDPAALPVLAAAKRTNPRDLVIGLEQLWFLGEKLTPQIVKETFGVDQGDILASYFRALAAGNSGDASSIIESWSEPPQQKAQWISNMTLSIYHNNILGNAVIIDPLIHAGVGEHSGIVTQFRERVAREDESAFTAFWVSLLEFWARHRAVDDSAALLAISLFQHLAINGLASLPITSGTRGHDERFDPCALWPKPEPESDQDELPGNASEYILSEDVREIVRRASFFTQQFGKWFNVGLEIFPSDAARQKEAAAPPEIRKFISSFDEYCRAAGGAGAPPYAAISVIDLDEDAGYFGLLAGYIPGLETEEGARAFQSFLEAQSIGSMATERLELNPSFASSRAEDEARRFHWDAVFNLFLGAHDAPNSRTGAERGILDQLRIAKTNRRQPLPVPLPRLFFRGAVNAATIRKAQALGMDFLSAIDDQQWSAVRSGWEIDEFLVRRTEYNRRRKEFDNIAELYREDAVGRTREEARLLEGWKGRVKSLPREWKKHRRWR